MRTAIDWFTGKSRERAQEALLLLNQSKDLGQWVPGASRKVKAALNCEGSSCKKCERGFVKT